LRAAVVTIAGTDSQRILTTRNIVYRNRVAMDVPDLCWQKLGTEYVVANRGTVRQKQSIEIGSPELEIATVIASIIVIILIDEGRTRAIGLNQQVVAWAACDVVVADYPAIV